MSTSEKVFCSSSEIERDLNNFAGTFEHPDGIFVNKEDCVRCGVNCPKSPNYIPPSQEKLAEMLERSTRHRTFSL